MNDKREEIEELKNDIRDLVSEMSDFEDKVTDKMNEIDIIEKKIEELETEILDQQKTETQKQAEKQFLRELKQKTDGETL